MSPPAPVKGILPKDPPKHGAGTACTRFVVLRTDRVTIWKGGQGSCVFNSCIEKGNSAGVIHIFGEPGEFSSSSQHLKLQEPCPLLSLLTLVELLQL